MIKPGDLIEKFRYALNNNWGYIWGKAGDLWTEAQQKAATREQTVKYGAKWIGHYVADCSGLFSWAFKKLGGYMYHGSNTMYKSYCTAKGPLKNGKRTDGEELKPGTAVFCLRESDSIYSHVGLYCGNGEVIEAAGTQQGVISGKVSNSKWEYWGELKGVDYSGTQPEPTPEPEPGQDRPTLRRGSKGEYVTLLQTMLVNRGYDIGKTGVDGDFGKATEAAVKAFQRDHTAPDGKPLKVDGIVGKSTWAALDQQNEPITYTVTITGLTADQAEGLVKQFPDTTTVKKG